MILTRARPLFVLFSRFSSTRRFVRNKLAQTYNNTVKNTPKSSTVFPTLTLLGRDVAKEEKPKEPARASVLSGLQLTLKRPRVWIILCMSFSFFGRSAVFGFSGCRLGCTRRFTFVLITKCWSAPTTAAAEAYYFWHVWKAQHQIWAEQMDSSPFSWLRLHRYSKQAEEQFSVIKDTGPNGAGKTFIMLRMQNTANIFISHYLQTVRLI